MRLKCNRKLNKARTVFLKVEKKKMYPSFSPNIPNKIGSGINVSGKYTLKKNEAESKWRAAIADEPIDAKVDGKKMFCVRVDNLGANSGMMLGFTPLEKFDSNKEACFGKNGFNGCGIVSWSGQLCYPVDKYHDIMDRGISQKAKEIIVILTISNNGTKKEIRFLVDGKETKSSDVSEFLEGDRLFPAICLYDINPEVTTIPIDQIKKRTPEIENLTKQYQEQQKLNEAQAKRERFTSNALPQVLELQRVLLQQAGIQIRAMMARSKLEIDTEK
jgi:hypothetical protein